MITNKRLQHIVALILMLVAMRGILYGLVIPVDQTPDEIHHFRLIKAKQLQIDRRYDRDQSSVAARLELARQNLLYPESADRRTLANFKGANLAERIPSSRKLYYFVMAWMLKLFPSDNIVNEIYLVRGFSVLVGTLVVAIAFLVAYELFPDNLFLVIGIPMFITFIPQFSAMNASINNDKLAELFVSLFFLFLVRIFKYGMTWWLLSGSLIALVLALLGKRSASFIIPVLLFVFFLYWWKASLRLRMHLVIAGSLVVFGVALYFMIRYIEPVEAFVNRFVWLPAYKLNELLFRPELVSLPELKRYGKFFTVVYWSFWGLFGYMTIHLHHFWYSAIAIMQMTSGLGIAVHAIRSYRRGRHLKMWQAKALYVFGVGVSLAIVIPFFYSVILRAGYPTLSQGRYLFTAIIPIATLTMFGLSELIPPKQHRVAGIIGFVGFLALDMVCLSRYLLLNFHGYSLF